MLAAFEQHEEHEPCRDCRYTDRFWGAVWFKPREKVEPLTWKDAYKRERKFMKLMKGNTWQFHESPADTLTPGMMENQLEIWKE